ncbi:pilus assembly protein [Mitsuaria sp. BK037]|uniref:pilus assembly protein n=1 Tax=Mitsuaria sp. BK037 TaxID=2587122 RepID=UPI00161D2E7B|nr:PilC/PilY family type IV pilus protein [Mitsuaria sp. BK037]MBB3283031.1 type IV pilus assembly protein PilY1 [Mitsuaria sp. BK037]
MFPSRLSLRLSGAAALLAAMSIANAQTVLADKPVFASVAVPGNLALALSVEYPTAVSNAHTDATYNPASTYLGYFDPNKCYDYRKSTTAIPVDHFAPTAKAASHVCSKKWSGNFLNYATMQTIDPFRWALTGGSRVVDTTTATVLQKAYASGQGNTGNFPDRSITSQTIVAGATPLVDQNGNAWNGLKMRIQGLGVSMRISNSGDNNSGNPTAFDPTSSSWNGGVSYLIDIRVRVCDNTLSSANNSYLEQNCKPYANNTIYKPEGLIQDYASQIRFSAFGYLNDATLGRDGGVLRSRQKYVGPTKPVPGGDPVANAQREWDPNTGIMVDNPNVDASANINDVADMAAYYGVNVSYSGVMNYLNKFGASGSYKTYDPVGELYYAALRYYRNLGNVASYSAPSSKTTRAAQADGFPVISNWGDPMEYSCQKNFILGIGDVNTHADRNLPGATGSSEPTKPTEVTDDKAFDAVEWTNRVGKLSGVNASLGNVQGYNGCCNNNGALIAGMAYWANSTDIRPDAESDKNSAGMQTVQTYWLDVLEFGAYKSNNQYYLATRYGGANLPTDFNPLTRTTDLTQGWWHTGDSSDTVGGQLRPDTYFTAAKADQMVSGLSNAFASIASRMKAYSTAFSTASQQITAAGVASYATQYDAKQWTGEVIASTLSAANGSTATTQVEAWRFSTKLAAQLAGTGWKDDRRVVTYNTDTKRAVRFQKTSSVGSAQQAGLVTSYNTTDTTDEYVNYLRGDQSNEGTGKYRTRSSLVGDIVNSKVTVVAQPSMNLSEGANPGYAAYKAAVATKKRPNYLVVGTNAGMVHVIDGSLTGSTAGREIFAYIPGALFAGPSNPATPGSDGLAILGNPNFNHRFFVDARPTAMDVDFGYVDGQRGAADWHTIVVGGLGKGGRSVYALDLTDLSDVTSEDDAVRKVLWEFTAPDMGMLFGEPVITKTATHGWVVLVPTGHNNASGKARIYVLNPKTGAIITTISADALSDDASAGDPAGLNQLTPFYPDLSTLVVESVYGGDLRGNVWRADLRSGSNGYPNLVKVARAVGPNNTPQPITTAVVPIGDTNTYRRFLAFGTGKMLNANDINSTQLQRLYGVVDGTVAKFSNSGDAPTNNVFPITSANLVQLTDLTQKASIDYKVKSGWYFDLPSGYRVLNDPTYYLSFAAFSATLPSTADACNPGGVSRVYLIDLSSGQTQFANNAAYLDPGFAVTDMLFVKTDEGVDLVLSGSTPSSPKTTCDAKDPTCNVCPPGDPLCRSKPNQGSAVGAKILNWREIPLRNSTNGAL